MPAVANSTVNRELTTLKKLFSLAVANRKLKENPMRFVKMLEEPSPRERFLTVDEKNRLLESVSSDKKLQAIVLLALLTGWRKSQILSVRKSDLDFEHLVVLRKKSKRAPARKVPVSSSAWNIFASLAANADDYLFTNRDGKPLKDFKESWWSALKRAEIEGFRFHDLRHIFSSELILSGANPLVVRDALGHAQLSTTEIYMQMQSSAMQKALDDHADNNPDYVM
jgi:integrase